MVGLLYDSARWLHISYLRLLCKLLFLKTKNIVNFNVDRCMYFLGMAKPWKVVELLGGFEIIVPPMAVHGSRFAVHR